MPVQFLSEEWTNELTQRLNQDPQFQAAITNAAAKLQQVITTPDGERRYWLRIEDGTIAMGQGDIESPDATVSQDYETAKGMAEGQVNPVSAFMSGKLRISGNMMLLMQLQSALSELGRVMQDMDIDY